MTKINYRIFLASIISFFFFFSFFQTSQAGFFDWFRKNDSQSSQSVAAVASKIKQYTLSVSKSGLGTITSDDGKINCGKQCKASYSANSKIVLKAEAGNNYKFEKWNGCDKVSDGKCQTTLNKSKTIVAKFVKKANSSSSSQKSSSKSSSSKSSGPSSKSSSSKAFSSNQASKSSNSVSSLDSSKIIINSCQEIIKSGNYILTNNIKSNNGTCLNIHDTNDVYIDCNNYTVWGEEYFAKSKYETENAGDNAVRFKNVNNFSLSSCKLGGESYVPLLINKSKNGNIKNNQIGEFYASSYDSSNLNFQNNKFSWYEQNYSNNVTMRDNVFDPQFSKENIRTFTSIGGVIISNLGSKNKFINNKINGNAEGLYEKQEGADDGIVIQDESEDLIQGNDIKNVWDCGIETLGSFSGTKIVENNIKNAGFCGIGGWYYNSWKDNVVTNNVAQDTPELFILFRTYGLRPSGWDIEKRMPADNFFYFKNNYFSGNKLINPRIRQEKRLSAEFNMSSPVSLSTIIGERYPVSSEIITKDNYFKNNDFSTVLDAPTFNPFFMVIDEGGNKCGSTQSKGGGSTNDYPLKCN